MILRYEYDKEPSGMNLVIIQALEQGMRMCSRVREPRTPEARSCHITRARYDSRFSGMGMLESWLIATKENL